MKKKGFTIVELLAVIAIMSIIIVLGTYGVNGIKKSIKKQMWLNKEQLILKMAVKFGEDHIDKLTKTCGVTRNCMVINVQTLLDRRYINSSDFVTDQNGEKRKVIYDDRSGTEINEKCIDIYEENNFVYARWSNKVTNFPEEGNSDFSPNPGGTIRE